MFPVSDAQDLLRINTPYMLAISNMLYTVYIIVGSSDSAQN